MSSLFTERLLDPTFSPNHISPCGYLREIRSIPIDRFSVSCLQSPIWVAFLLFISCVWFRSVEKGRLVPSIYIFCLLKRTTFIRKHAINYRRSSHDLSLEASQWSGPALYLTVPAIFRDSPRLMIRIKIQISWLGFQRAIPWQFDLLLLSSWKAE
jgi:hypothetical protein